MSGCSVGSLNGARALHLGDVSPERETPMPIHIGYDLHITLSAPTPVMLLRDVHPSRTNDLLNFSPVTIPGIEIAHSVDFYGNRMPRLLAPAGAINLSASGVIKDPGTLDPVFLDAQESPSLICPAAACTTCQTAATARRMNSIKSRGRFSGTPSQARKSAFGELLTRAA